MRSRHTNLQCKLCASFLVIFATYLTLWKFVFSSSRVNSNRHDRYVIKLPNAPAPRYKQTYTTMNTKLLPALKYFRVSRKVKQLNCRAIIDGDIEIEYKKENFHAKDHILMFRKWTKDCSLFKKRRGYILDPLTLEEKSFPIAFSIIMYTDVKQMERLLRAVYRPQNYYCIHVDAKVSSAIWTAVQAVASCFQNVFVLEQRVNVTWGTMSVLEPDLLCMAKLWGVAKNWKYFINLTGQEFPLRTNYELVQILKRFNGTSDVEGTISRANKDRWKSAGPVPHRLTPVKGSVHVVLSRAFSDFVLHDNRAWDLLRWLKNTRVPDETFFSTLNHNPSLNIPGSYADLSALEQHYIKPTVTRYKSWPTGPKKYPCHGKRVHTVCIFGTRDLRILANRPELFANKFYLGYQHALDCMEELLFNRTRDQYLGLVDYDTSWYSNLEFVQRRV